MSSKSLQKSGLRAKREVRLRHLSLVGAAMLATLGVMSLSAAAQTPSESKYGPLIPATNFAAAAPPVLRTSDDMARDAGFGPAGSAAPGVVINAPTIPLTEYNAAKAFYSRQPAQPKSAGSSATSAGPNASVRGVNFQSAVEGENGQNWVPPDVHMAVGATQVVQTTNSSIDVWSKVSSGTPTHLKTISQNSFTGNGTDTLGDARVVYDWLWNRWVITIDDFATGNTTHLSNSGSTQFYICISRTSDATGAWWIYGFGFNTSPASLFWDFPQLGMDQDAILITGNWFQGNSFFSPSAFAVPKARAYNGLGWGASFGFLGSSTGTVAPPIVLAADQDRLDYFLAAPVGSSKTNVLKFTMANAGRTGTSLSGPVNIPVASYTTPPPDAPQTCGAGSNALDTSDGRFQNASIQNGTRLWNTHTVALGSTFPVIRWYEFLTDNTVRQYSTKFLSATSFDFNPSIASPSGDAAVLNWTATDPNAGTPRDAMMIIAGRQSTSVDALNVMNVNTTPVIISSACMTDNFDPNFGMQRWGDYSTVSLDFTGISPNFFYWVANEYTTGNVSSQAWATRVARTANP